MTREMYYCKELDEWHYEEYYGWFENDSDAIKHFEDFMKKRKKAHPKKQRWLLGRVLPQNNISRELSTKRIKEFEL